MMEAESVALVHVSKHRVDCHRDVLQASSAALFLHAEMLEFKSVAQLLKTHIFICVFKSLAAYDADALNANQHMFLFCPGAALTSALCVCCCLCALISPSRGECRICTTVYAC